MKIGTIYDITFSTTKVDTGEATNADSLPIVRITENGSLLAYTPTVSNLTTGLYIVTIDSSFANGFEVGKRYTVYATATVNSIAGAEGLDSFTVDAQSIDDVLPTSSYTAPDNASIASLPTLAEIEASTILAKETSISAIPTNPLLADDARLNNLDAPISGAGGGGGLTTEQDEKLTRIDERVDTPVSEIAVGWNPYIEGVTNLKKGIQKIVDKVEEKGEEVKKTIEDEVKTIVIPKQKEPIVNVTTEKIDTKEFLKAIKEIKPEVKVTTETVNNEPILNAIREVGNISDIKFPKQIEPKEIDLGPIQVILSEVKTKINEDSEKIDKIEDYIESKLEEDKREMKQEEEKQKEMQEEEILKQPLPESFTATLN